jgi:hypothetical protein
LGAHEPCALLGILRRLRGTPSHALAPGYCLSGGSAWTDRRCRSRTRASTRALDLDHVEMPDIAGDDLHEVEADRRRGRRSLAAARSSAAAHHRLRTGLARIDMVGSREQLREPRCRCRTRSRMPVTARRQSGWPRPSSATPGAPFSLRVACLMATFAVSPLPSMSVRQLPPTRGHDPGMQADRERVRALGKPRPESSAVRAPPGVRVPRQRLERPLPQRSPGPRRRSSAASTSRARSSTGTAGPALGRSGAWSRRGRDPRTPDAACPLGRYDSTSPAARPTQRRDTYTPPKPKPKPTTSARPSRFVSARKRGAGQARLRRGLLHHIPWTLRP